MVFVDLPDAIGDRAAPTEEREIDMTPSDHICDTLKSFGWSYGYQAFDTAVGSIWIAAARKDAHQAAARGIKLEDALAALLQKVYAIEREHYPDPDDDPLTPEEALRLLDDGCKIELAFRLDPMPSLPPPVSDWPGKAEEIERLKREGGEP